MAEQHPFAPYIKILARGKSFSRPLTLDEAEDAFGMILDGRACAEQIGAFLMLLRFKEEHPEEVAGMVRAARARLPKPDAERPSADLDWPSYAGKRRHLPWYVLSALLLAEAGVKVSMHGEPAHTAGRVYTEEALESLGVASAPDLGAAQQNLAQQGFSYLPLSRFAPELHRLMGLKALFGLRNPVHTVARMLNPLAAPSVLQGIFHLSFLDTHQSAGELLGDAHYAVFRGEGGEGERRPEKPFKLRLSGNRESQSLAWAGWLKQVPEAKDGHMDIARLRKLWAGQIQDAYAEAAIASSAALGLWLVGRADSPERADAMAKDLWAERHRSRF